MINGKYEICSFYTIVPSSISRENLLSNLAKKLPFYPIPVFLLTELAVNSKYHGQGLGKITLIKALKFALEVNTFMKGYAVIVDCLNQSAEDFYLKYDFEKLLKYEGRTRMFLPMKTIEMLFHE